MDILGSKCALREAFKGRIRMLYTEGYDIDVDAELKKADSIPDSYDALIAYGETLYDLPVRVSWPYREPFALDEIRSLRPKDRIDTITPTQKELYLRPVVLKDKVYGGVQGKIIACMLGKPFEMGWNASQVRKYLEACNAWPLDNYAPMYSRYSNLGYNTELSRREYIAFAQADDDTSYLAIALQALEQYGRDFTTQELAHVWLENLPFLETFGPGHTTLRKLVDAKDWHEAPLPTGEEWNRLIAFGNSGEEQIDAMIRADAYGLICPLQPEQAAALAYKDGILTNRHTGLYAGMFVAGCIAGAFYYRDPLTVIRCGLGQIPETSRYAEAIRQAIDIAASADSWEAAYPEIDRRWGHLGHAGTFNETAAIINALIHSVDSSGCMDFEKAICTTVMHGWDTDCSGATCGCIAGVMAGSAHIPEKWLKPLNDTFFTYLAQEHDHSITSFAERMLQMSKR